LTPYGRDEYMLSDKEPETHIPTAIPTVQPQPKKVSLLPPINVSLMLQDDLKLLSGFPWPIILKPETTK
jgi:hypothetical protein